MADLTARPVVESIASEYTRYRKLAASAIVQLTDDQLCEGSESASSVAVLAWHVSGNLESRFTDFLTTDGEKPWRNRDSEFVARSVTRAELLEKLAKGFATLEGVLASLTDADLAKAVLIRTVPHSVLEALQRSLGHTAYHVGQIVYVAKAMRGTEWESLSIPLGKSEEFNKSMGLTSLTVWRPFSVLLSPEARPKDP